MTADFRSTETTNFLSKYSLAIKILCVGQNLPAKKHCISLPLAGQRKRKELSTKMFSSLKYFQINLYGPSVICGSTLTIFNSQFQLEISPSMLVFRIKTYMRDTYIIAVLLSRNIVYTDSCKLLKTITVGDYQIVYSVADDQL